MEKLSLALIRKNLALDIRKGLSLDLSDFAEEKYGDTVDYDVFLPSKNKNLQRPFVWTLEQKQELILSVLKGIRIPSIAIIQYKPASGNNKITYKIIDGKQRLSTLVDYYHGRFPIVFEGKEYFISDLTERAAIEIKRFSFTCDIVYEYDYKMIPDDEKIKWFELINFVGTPQDIEHLNNLKA